LRAVRSWWRRARAKNEIHAVLVRRLKAARQPATCSASRAANAGGLQLPVEERDTVDAGVRHIAFLDGELAQVERVIALHALDWPTCGG
jgi:hypothetical protein